MSYQAFFIDAVAKATVLLTAAGLIDFLLQKRTSAAVRHRLWAASFLALLLLPALSLALPSWELAILPAHWIQSETPDTNPISLAVVDAQSPTRTVDPVSQIRDFETNTDAVASNSTLPSVDSSPSNQTSVTLRPQLPIDETQVATSQGMNFTAWQPALVMLFVFGFLVTLSPLLLGLLRNAYWDRSATLIEEEEDLTALRELCRRLAIRRPVKLLETQQSIVPMTWGIFHPVVILPRQWRTWLIESRRLVLLHELAHVKRLDVVYQCVARVACSMFWFHPLAWYALQRLRIERELACDDCVLMAGERPSSYAKQLLDIAREFQSMALPPAVAMAQRSGLEQRVRAVLDKARSHLPVSPRVAKLLLLGSLAITTLLAAVRLEAIAGREVAAENAVSASADELLITGHVVGPDGQPVAGARVVALREFLANTSWKETYVKLAETISAADGSYAVKVPRVSERFSDGRSFEIQTTHVLASKNGLGPDQVLVNAEGGATDLNLAQATKVLEGKVVDLEGRPLAGVAIRVTEIKVAASSLDEWVKQAAKNPAAFSDEMRMSAMYDADGPKLTVFPEDHTIAAMETLSFPVARTDQNGTFRISGIGDDREVTLRLDGDSISSTFLTAVTRDMPAVNMPGYGLPTYRTGKTFGAKFVVSGEPSQIIRGRIVDRKSQAPIADAVVRLASYADNMMSVDDFLTTRTNDRGEFVLVGVPKAPKNSRGVRIEVVPPRDRPYFNCEKMVPIVDGLEPIDVNLQLTRGIWIEGQATDTVTGKPVRGTAAYYPRLDNEYANDHEAFDRGMHTVGYNDGRATDQEGRFRIPALPGAGAVRFVAETPEQYELEGPSWGSLETGTDPWKLYHISMPGNAMPRIKLPADQEIAKVDIALTAEPAKRFHVVDSDGKPLTGYKVGGQFPSDRPTISGRGATYWGEAQNTPDLDVVLGSDEDAKQPLMFFHSERELAAVVEAKAWRENPTEVTTVTLKPCAKLVGRLAFPEGADSNGALIAGYGAIKEISYMSITSDGKPLKSPPRKQIEYRFENRHSYQKDGTFSLTIPASDNTSVYYGGGPKETTILDGKSLTPGEVLDLGEIDMSASDVAGSVKSKLSTIESKAVSKSVAYLSQKATTQEVADPQTAQFNFEGVVLDPQGKPVADAKLHYVVHVAGAHPRNDLKPVAQTDEKGNFQFQVKRIDFERMYGRKWQFTQLYAYKEGFGVAGKPAAVFETTGAMLTDLPEAKPGWLDKITKDKKIHLVADDQPVVGRVVTVDGLPVEGARVRVHELWMNDSGSLDGWEKAAKHPKADYYSLRNEVSSGLNSYQLPSLIPDTHTDKNGQFILTGLGRERIAELLVESPTIETAIIKTRTRAGEIVVVPHQFAGTGRTETYYPREFSHVAAPSVLVSGRVTDSETGKPITNMSVSGGMQAAFVMGGKTYIRTRTDADGRYEIQGLSLDGNDRLHFVPPADSRYLPQTIQPDIKGRREPLTHDMSFKPAPMITGRVVDGRTGQPVEGAVRFLALRTNENLRSYGQFSSAHAHETRTNQDGSFSIAAVPGEGFITVMAIEHAKFKRAAASLKPGTSLNEDTPGMYMTVPTILIASDVHFLQKIDVKTDAPNEFQIELNSGETATGKILAADGKPATDVIYKGRVSRSGWWPSDTAEQFTIEGYYENEPRDIFFYQPGTNAAALLQLRGKLPETLSVKLEPAATIRGRLLDKAGLPLVGLPVRGSDIIDNNSGRPDLKITTDDKGNFEIPGIIPGHSYSAFVIIEGQGVSSVFKDMIVENAEVRDLGAITIESE